MEPKLQAPTDTATYQTTQPRRPQHDYFRHRRNPSGTAAKFGGIHLRRDKRFPLSKGQRFDALPPTPIETAAVPDNETLLKAWREAVMLWLSWNSSQEKLTEKMCKPGYDQQKLEALMDEMDQLRQQAIELSERLVRQ